MDLVEDLPDRKRYRVIMEFVYDSYILQGLRHDPYYLVCQCLFCTRDVGILESYPISFNNK